MFDTEKIMVAAHRGYRSEYPENTMLAFEKAMKLDVDMIEYDLHITKDGKLVIIHDSSLERTTTGKGKVSDYNYEELRKFDAGAKLYPVFVGQKIPLHEEFLELAAPSKLLFNVEIKDYYPVVDNKHPTVDLAIKQLDHYGILDRCVLACFDGKILKYIHKKYGIRCQGFVKESFQNYEEGEDGTYSHMYSVGLHVGQVSSERVNEFKTRGIRPWSWCADTEDMVKESIENGIELMTCNDPIPAINYLKRNSLR
ncbi:MAG: glycerophosphoryl diester phosphodiesterase [Clostridia bacterium]|nr:glycerophosphoryl diester phosphodiesterase [Clostridia bacterium]